MSEKIKNIKSRLGRNTFDRESIGHVGIRTQGERYRARTLKADHKRNIAKQAGYPDVISLRQHYDMAYRNGLGSNLAFSIVDDTWRVDPIIYDGKEDVERRKNNPTKFESAVDEHFCRLQVFERLKGLDKAQRPMRYGAMQFVTSEGDSSTTKDKLVRLPSIEYLIGLRVYHEAQLPVEVAHQNPAFLNYGMPKIFNLRTNVAGSTNEWESSGCQIDATRVYAFGEGALDGSIYGVPCLESCFEALMDASKVRMSGAEGFFQNASNKYANILPENATAADADSVLDSMEDFDNELQRSLVTVGEVKMLQTTLNDPTHAWTIAVNECAAAHNKPMTIIVGHQTGERASGEDLKNWNRVIMDRQEQVANDMIDGLLLEFIEKFTFPPPTNEVNIVWRDLNESTADQKVDLANKRAETNKKCIESKMQPIYSTEYMQKEAGAPIEDVVVLDVGGEDDDKTIDSVKK